ncbi:MAG: 7-cyano-7-deazaguanine synthase QueC [Vulcanimicrobiota bacterium]
MTKALVLLSGGLDSTVMLAMIKARNVYNKIYALSFDYGQRHKNELNCAIQQAIHYSVWEHQVVNIDMTKIGGSSLTDKSMEVPKDRHEKGFDWTIPSTYVPARNTIFLAFALGYAETINAQDIYIGANQLDFAGYPDCRPEYFRAFERMANLSTAKAVEGELRFSIITPLIKMSKEEIITRGKELSVDFARTFSCYDPDGSGRACRTCDACKLRLEGFEEAGMKDPAVYIDREREELLQKD